MMKLEQIARAMWEQRSIFFAAQGIDLDGWGNGSIPTANGIMEEARAAVEAMREPGFALCKTGSLPNVHPGVVDAIWKIMIDAILNEKPGGGE